MPESPSNPQSAPSVPSASAWLLTARSAVGGVFMGLANLVPGISGGTMLLAAGVYPQFITAIAELTTGRCRRRSMLVLGVVVLAALAAIVAFAPLITWLVVGYRWAMFSLFIGLTLGGVPVVWRLIGRPTVGVWIAAAVGFVGMAMLGLAQASGAVGGGGRESFVLLLLAGIAGASAMILPGISGAYLLLLMGVYLTITSAIKDCLHAVKAGDFAELLSLGLAVVLPVAIGVVVGVVAVSNLLKWLLTRYEKPTLGVLLGLLVGAVVGLWPFQEGIEPLPGEMLKGQVVELTVLEQAGEEQVLIFSETREPVEPKDFRTAFFTPTVGQAAAALALAALGFGVTWSVSWLGRERD